MQVTYYYIIHAGPECINDLFQMSWYGENGCSVIEIYSMLAAGLEALWETVDSDMEIDLRKAKSYVQVRPLRQIMVF